MLYLLYLNFRPFSRLEPDGCKQEPRYLVGKDSEPNSGDAPCKHDTAQVGEECPDDRDADSRCNCSVCRVAGAPKTPHIDDLGNLEQHNKNDDMDNLYTVGNNIVLLKKQPVKRLSAQKVNDCQRDGNAHSDTPADPSVLLCLFG